MKKAMLSQPMAGKTDEEIIATREQAIKALEAKGYEIVNTLFTDEWYSNEKMKERGVVQIPLCFLAKSLENMSLCHAAYFCKGWENARAICRMRLANWQPDGVRRLSLPHRFDFSKRCFLIGLLTAVNFIISQTASLYSMKRRAFRLI